jgi:predicted O-methyltransferase YrrM
MSKESFIAIDRYYEKLLLDDDPRFEQIHHNMIEAGLPSIQVSPLQGKLLQLLVQMHGSQRVLEIGSLGGFSTAWLARGLPLGGRLISLEIDRDRAALARKNLEAFDFGSQVEIREGDALQLMVEMAQTKQDPFDMIFIDGDKSQYPEYLDLSIQLSQPGTLIVADNVIKHGRVFNQVINTPDQKGISKFHEKVASDPRLEGSVIQTVGYKGHDGLAFILVKEAAV